MKKIVVTVIICILTAIVLVSCFYMPELFSKVGGKDVDTYIIETDKTEYANKYDIIEALKEGYDFYKGEMIETGKTMTAEEVSLEFKSLFYSVVGTDLNRELNIDRIIPYYTKSGDRVVWCISSSVIDVQDDDNTAHFIAVFDENTKKVVSIQSDSTVTIDGYKYAYEEISENKYVPDDEKLNEAYQKADEFAYYYAEYLDMSVGQVYFDHYNFYRYTFNAELIDSHGEVITVNISYNITNGKYNFNY